MYYGVIYFAGPKTRWSGRIDDSEIIATFCAPWRWLARALLMTTFIKLDQDRCGYALLRDGICLEQHDPPPE